MAGQWFGLGAGRLNLAGAVGESQFVALCDNRHPTDDRKLTQRTNLFRRDPDGSAENRRIFYDFTFSPPKSVSVVGLVGEDRGVLAAHERAVRVALGEFEAFAPTRVRKGGENGVRRTGNVVAASFTHETSRALDPRRLIPW
ncbi:MAG: relaxase domain-containing protein [Verrucomicrobiales bacterium]|nr:relaxase domain-containing protein [Verrucomicrobiales bacterium]